MADRNLDRTPHPDDGLLLDVALGQADPPMRHEVGTHLVGCAPCRIAYDELAGAIERVLPAVPRVAPPPDFETAVLARLGERRRSGTLAAEDVTVPATTGASSMDARHPASGAPRRGARRWLVPVVAGVVGLAGGGLIPVLLHDPPARTVSAGTPIVTGDGERVGNVTRTIAEGGPALVVALDDGPTGASYTCRLVLADGSVQDAGEWKLRSDGVNSWVVADPGVQKVELVAQSGRVWSSAEL